MDARKIPHKVDFMCEDACDDAIIFPDIKGIDSSADVELRFRLGPGGGGLEQNVHIRLWMASHSKQARRRAYRAPRPRPPAPGIRKGGRKGSL